MLRPLILPCIDRLFGVGLLYLVRFIYSTVAIHLTYAVGGPGFCGERGGRPLRVDSACGHFPDILVHTHASRCHLFHFFLDEFTLTWCCCQVTICGLEIV